MNPLRAPSHDGVWGKLPPSPALPSLRLCSSPQRENYSVKRPLELTILADQEKDHWI
ncbi:hypothetical protein DPMN_005784 [Dreissena polymorpha]|uniref:Uncharacterized protein n=1 Tax=Dreissena polymorpha TaxID=45954 RepID=A0A9D4MQA6_DREPO|nr:hypothetical protein DPMN_003338 [Dreissena polymorpha]KAH3881857.1 hypothetical protein DPMN_005784 [Dreissena polymorpha]